MACLFRVRSKTRGKIIEGFIDRYKSVAGMDEAGIDNASRAEIPVWAVEALVTNTIDVLFFVSYTTERSGDSNVPCHIHHK